MAEAATSECLFIQALMPARYYIGTSGWSYDHWKEIFYLRGLLSKDWLGYYVKSFTSVEINNTFYHLPKEATFANWQAMVPAGFIFSVKASRFITHVKRLKDAAEPVAKFIDRAKLLGDNLGPILFQLPPNWRLDIDRFTDFVDILPAGLDYVFEYRDHSWFDPRLYQLMSQRDLGFCIHDMAGLNCPRIFTSRLVYIRLHGASAKYQGKYSPDQLADWSELICQYLRQGRKVFIYFNNDAFGYALENAKELERLIAVSIKARAV